MELVYSTQKSGFEPGRHYQNPRYFDGRIPAGVSHVYILGEWPKVVEACEALELAHTVLPPGSPISWKDGVAPRDPEQKLVEIPATWQHFGQARLIAIAKSICGHDITKRKDAVRVIEDELERRQAGAGILPADQDNPDEINAGSEEDPSEDEVVSPDGENADEGEPVQKKSRRNRRK